MFAPVDHKQSQFSATHLFCLYFNVKNSSSEFVGIHINKNVVNYTEIFWPWHQSDIHFPSQPLGKYFQNAL